MSRFSQKGNKNSNKVIKIVTIKELKKMAKKLGLKGYSKINSRNKSAWARKINRARKEKPASKKGKAGRKIRKSSYRIKRVKGQEYIEFAPASHISNRTSKAILIYKDWIPISQVIIDEGKYGKVYVKKWLYNKLRKQLPDKRIRQIKAMIIEEENSIKSAKKLLQNPDPFSTVDPQNLIEMSLKEIEGLNERLDYWKEKKREVTKG